MMMLSFPHKAMLLGIVSLLALGGTACTRPHQYMDVNCAKMAGATAVDREAAIQCQTFQQTEAATAVYHETAALVKSYRACLGKYESMPGRGKEYCDEYAKALTTVVCTKVAGDAVLGREVAVQCENTRQADAATAVYGEATLLVKSYRTCLEKYEQMPSRAREYCGQYAKALQDIGLQVKETPDPSTTPNPAVLRESRPPRR